MGWYSVQYITEYKDGKKHGLNKYYKNGKLRASAIYVEGIREGDYMDYDANGTLYRVTKFVAGRKVEPVIFYDHGKLKEGLYKTNDTQGKLKRVEHYKHGILDGKKLLYLSADELWLDEMYKEGLKEGLCLEYIGGKVKKSAHYKQGLLDGTYREYYPHTNQLYREAYYVKGKLEGSEKIFYKSGTLRSETFYKEGCLIGDKRELFEDGSILFTVTYKNCVKSGTSRTFYHDGRLRSRVAYKNGKVVSVYNEDGSVETVEKF